jgi:thiamine-monophosphate kinase
MTRRPLVEGEEAIIQEFLAPLSAGAPGAYGLADDCATIAPSPGHELVLKTDPIAEGVHFLPGEAAADVAWKALAVNVSDLAAKAARPLAYLMALSLPEPPTRTWLADFAAGLDEAQRAFSAHLIGGDTDRRPGPLTVSITVLGEVPAGSMIRRSGARAGDRLLVSGTIGDAALGLRLRRDGDVGGRQPGEADRQLLVRRHLRPEPRLGLACALKAGANAAMDISDGLVKDAGRLCRASGLAGVIVLADVPQSAAARRLVGDDDAPRIRLATGGDDYEVLMAVPPDRLAAVMAEAAAAGIPLTEIGIVRDGPPGLDVIGANGLPVRVDRSGWDHF